MAELIAMIFFVSGMLGIVIILFRRIPFLVGLPAVTKKSSKDGMLLSLKNRITNISFFKFSSPEMYLQKILSKIRVLILRLENKISDWLQSLRQRSLKKKNNYSGNYWQELKEVKEDKLKTKRKKTAKKNLL